MATFTVTSANDGGAGSLRQAVLNADAAAGADTIVSAPASTRSRRSSTPATCLSVAAALARLDLHEPARSAWVAAGGMRRSRVMSLVEAVAIVAVNGLLAGGAC